MSITKLQFVVMLACICAPAASGAYTYDANDFATQVIEYAAGDNWKSDWITGLPFTNPANALGRPTVDTTGDNYNIIPVSAIVPVASVYQAFRSFELVTVGDGGHLILKFNHPVRHDENNPYGIDFIVFGNAQLTASTPWTNGNPNNCFVYNSSLIENPGTVSVSQDGIHWYSFTNGPRADSFAPTLGRIYDTNNPDKSIGAWNLWWGHPTNPTLPLDPNLTKQTFAGKSVAKVAQLYGESAGGTGFSLTGSGMDWIQYVKIDGTNDPDIDAVADVSSCGDWKHPFPDGDINHDCQVDYDDLAILASHWLHQITGTDDPAATADIYQDDVINLKDWAIMAETWQECTWQCR